MRFTVDAALFDLDGVIVDSEQINLVSARRALAELDIPLSDELLPLVIGRHPMDYVPLIIQRLGLRPETTDRVLETQDRLYSSIRAERLRLLPGARATLERLTGRGLRLALVTSSGRETARESLRRFAITRHFEAVITAHDVARRKPDPQPYQAALDALGLPPARAVAIEDSPTGISAARDAGLPVIAVASPAFSPAEVAHATCRVGGTAELAELIHAA